MFSFFSYVRSADEINYSDTQTPFWGMSLHERMLVTVLADKTAHIPSIFECHPHKIMAQIGNEWKALVTISVWDLFMGGGGGGHSALLPLSHTPMLVILWATHSLTNSMHYQWSSQFSQTANKNGQNLIFFFFLFWIYNFRKFQKVVAKIISIPRFILSYKNTLNLN